MSAVGSITDAVARFANRRAAIGVMAAWGFGEALVLPIVPDVLLCLLAAAAPRRALALFGWVVVGAMAGSMALAALAIQQPATAADLVLHVPAIDRPMLNAATEATAGGDPLSMAHFGPGTPLKVYTVAWWSPGGTGLLDGFVAGVVANRLERIGPPVLATALFGLLLPRLLRRRERVLLAAYLLWWTGYYVIRFGA